MEYLTQVYWLLSWPLLILASYYLIGFSVNKYEKMSDNESDK